MGVIEDIMKALDRIPVWKRLQEIPGEVDVLKQRVADLESRLGAKWPGDVCKFCGARTLRLSHTRPINSNQAIEQRWHCETCDKTETRLVRT